MKLRFNYLAVLFLCLFVQGVSAQIAGDGTDNWEYVAEIYLWGANVDVTNPDGSSSEIRFTDLAQDLELGFMAALGAQRGNWLLLADFIYLDVDDDVEDQVLPGVELKTLGLEGWIINGAVGYRIHESERHTLQTLAGARYLWLEAPLTFRFDDPLPPGREKISESEGFVDGVVGFRGHWRFSPKWYLTYHADVGTGDSDTTWQGLGAIVYRFDNFDAVLGYRYLDWSLDDDEPLQDLNLSGVFAGIKFIF
ncbi:MAG: hypothetical protein GWP63_14960 [Haliea sp.]|jgi:hypothetical protein|nr:hypothetical protein [Haliea sp.]